MTPGGEHEGTPGPIERRYLADGFGRRLRQLRRRAGLTQQQLADRADRTRGHVSRLERGLRRPEWRTLLLLSQALAPTRAEQKAIRVELRMLAGDSAREWRRGGRHYVASVEAELPAVMAKVNRQLRVAGLDEMPPLPGAGK
ncbi:helix-turn-helix domain-containing protein [Actinophytocola oryzae]|uniref:helix-turn-helix domain-containing protein n=1 Tax=Actinophytocola oryzae TaxID=502181 RepID=UPI001AAF3EC4|nr:helix-turn-helix transcriptional regulator [Actinophytocola oryzae]